jgi:DNA topoisomerase-1
MKSLVHNGIIVLQPPDFPDFDIIIRGDVVSLNPLQSEMAVAWVKKLGTPYAEDPVFVKNFLTDFSKALNINPSLELDEIDFGAVIEYVEEERAKKEAMTKEERKAAREERKAKREALKEHYGYALVDGVRMELANYQTEPSGIFMGRGKHPLRGRWKQGACYSDITLNLSPDASIPEGDWKETIWASDTMWIAKWTDELTGKTKYIWLHDSSPIKQKREAEKFDKAMKLEKHIDAIRAHISEGLHSDESKRRMIAAACYLIDKLSLRVGDEKNPDEADTVGATTLRVEHLTVKNGLIVFDFLGKDSVPWHKELRMPPDVYRVFQELYDNAEECVLSFKSRKRKKTRTDPMKVAQIFPSVGSNQINRFLSEIYPDLTAKDFRTYEASITMRDELAQRKPKRKDPDFIKKEAFKRANLEVARVMNHTKQAPKGWSRRAKRYEERIKKTEKRIKKAKDALADKKTRLRKRKKKEKERRVQKESRVKKQKALVERYLASVRDWREKRDKSKASWDSARDRKRHIRSSKRKGKTTKKARLEEAQEQIDRVKERLEKAEAGLKKARDRYEKSKIAFTKKQDSLKEFKEKSTERIARAEKTVTNAKERVKKAELAKQKIEIDYALARKCRTWNLGTSLKSYIHPKIVYQWCQKIDYEWRKVYSKALQRKFEWVEQ